MIVFIDNFSVLAGLLKHLVLAFLRSSSQGLKAGTPVSVSKLPEYIFSLPLCFLSDKP